MAGDKLGLEILNWAMAKENVKRRDPNSELYAQVVKVETRKDKRFGRRGSIIFGDHRGRYTLMETIKLLGI